MREIGYTIVQWATAITLFIIPAIFGILTWILLNPTSYNQRVASFLICAFLYCVILKVEVHLL